MRLTTQLPFKDNESFTNFSIDSKPFRNTGIVNLTVNFFTSCQFAKLKDQIDIVPGY
jgi:hypothetical protein